MRPSISPITKGVRGIIRDVRAYRKVLYQTAIGTSQKLRERGKVIENEML